MKIGGFRAADLLSVQYSLKKKLIINWQVISNDRATHIYRFRQKLFRNMGELVLMGECATNAIPGLAAIAGVIFVVNAIFETAQRDVLIITKAIRHFAQLTKELLNTEEVAAAILVIGIILLSRRT